MLAHSYSEKTLIILFVRCWNEEVDFNWVYKIPCIATVFLNLVFLACIVYVLVSILNNTHNSDHAAIVKTAKAIGNKAKFSFSPENPEISQEV